VAAAECRSDDDVMQCVRVLASHGDNDAQNSVFLYLWIIAEVIRTCYTLTWDIKMDWGLLDRNAGENRFLREEVVYPRKVCRSVAAST